MVVLPLIDISALHGSERASVHKTADRLGAAAREIGFFMIIGHGIKPEIIERAYGAAQKFFALPARQKQRYYIGRNRLHRGYVPFTEKGDYPDEVHRNYEAFDLGLDLPEDDPDYLSGNLFLGPNLWPEMAAFKSAISHYYAQISVLGQKICKAFELHLGLEAGEITNQMSKPISQLRLLHYVRGQQTKNHHSVNMGAHTDYECLTLLHTRNPGLQVMNARDEWIEVPAMHEAYVVNIGDMLEAWTNGVFRSTPHRVLNLSPERYSIPYFVAANHDTIIKPLESLISAENPPRYEAFRAGEHLERMLMRDFPYLKSRIAKRVTKNKNTRDDIIQNPFETRLMKVVT